MSPMAETADRSGKAKSLVGVSAMMINQVTSVVVSSLNLYYLFVLQLYCLFFGCIARCMRQQDASGRRRVVVGALLVLAHVRQSQNQKIKSKAESRQEQAHKLILSNGGFVLSTAT